ncbi:hypothetical protein [Botryobacter ruber]|uniref:hypothetical protein n=1 Tax=Botryobacter ruber TaxID=2171629 RepID=UPI000E0BA0E1|nr:hypothetical protein [Botryobacter ruber]
MKTLLLIITLTNYFNAGNTDEAIPAARPVEQTNSFHESVTGLNEVAGTHLSYAEAPADLLDVAAVAETALPDAAMLEPVLFQEKRKVNSRSVSIRGAKMMPVLRRSFNRTRKQFSLKRHSFFQVKKSHKHQKRFLKKRRIMNQSRHYQRFQ